MKYLILLILLISGKAVYSQDTTKNLVIVILKDSSIRIAVETVIHVPPPNCRCIGYSNVVKYNYRDGELISDNPQYDGKIVNVFDYNFKKPENIWHHP